MTTNLIFKEESYKIIGACMNLHSEIGNKFTEPVYQSTLEILFQERGIPYRREVYLPIMFHGKTVEKAYKVDFLVFDKIILELKAVSALTDEHRSQILNYLILTGIQLGLLVNFGEKSLKYERVANLDGRNRIPLVDLSKKNS